MDNRNPPHPPLEDWTPALRHSLLDGMYGWVVNEEDIVIDATPDTADAAGLPISSYIGMDRRESRISAQIYDPPHDARDARIKKLWKEGGNETTLMHADLPGVKGHTAVLVTTTRITHPKTGRRYLLNTAHDVSDAEKQLAYLRAPAFQKLLMLVIEQDGTVLAATDAAASFCNPKLAEGQQLYGHTIDQTEWSSLRLREAEQLELSRKAKAPANAVEWLLVANNDYRPYAVARIAFPEGRWMIIMIPVPLTEPFLQLQDIKDVVKANNLNQPARVSEKEFQTLLEYYNKVEREDLAAHYGVTVGAIDKRRERLAKDKFGLDSVDDLLPAIRHTELGYLVQLYADRVCTVGSPCFDKE